MLKIKITKMQGLGNDFVILDYEEFLKTNLSMPDLAVKLCDRHFGIGADGMIIPYLKNAEKKGWIIFDKYAIIQPARI